MNRNQNGETHRFSVRSEKAQAIRGDGKQASSRETSSTPEHRCQRRHGARRSAHVPRDLRPAPMALVASSPHAALRRRRMRKKTHVRRSPRTRGPPGRGCAHARCGCAAPCCRSGAGGGGERCGPAPSPQLPSPVRGRGRAGLPPAP